MRLRRHLEGPDEGPPGPEVESQGYDRLSELPGQGVGASSSTGEEAQPYAETTDSAEPGAASAAHKYTEKTENRS